MLAALSTELKKGMIFTVFGIAERFKAKSPVLVVIICPLKSIIADQLAQLEGARQLK